MNTNSNTISMSPDEAIEVLRQGNLRFVNGPQQMCELEKLRIQQKDQQNPFVSILSCSDSRTPTEVVFDQSLGDIFSVRLAGNVASKEAIGSLEFSTKYLGTSLIVVMGHSSCGAIKGACDQLQDENINAIIDLIKPSVDSEASVISERNSGNEKFVALVCQKNIQHQIQTILKQSKIISELNAQNKIKIIGAVQDLATGIVEFNS